MMYEYTETKTIRKEIEILPCPFCGSNDVKPIHNSGCYGYSPSTDYVTCGNCGAMGGRVKDSNCGKNVEDAIRNWNIRVR